MLEGELVEVATARVHTCEAQSHVGPRPVPLHGHPLQGVQRVHGGLGPRSALSHLLLHGVVVGLALGILPLALLPATPALLLGLVLHALGPAACSPGAGADLDAAKGACTSTTPGAACRARATGSAASGIVQCD